MNFIELAKSRFSCRSYLDKPVENEKIMQVIEAARIAPSACNIQPWYFYVIKDDKDLLNKIHESYYRDWFNEAPVVIVCCADVNQAWVRKEDGKNHSDIDISIAIDHITLAATDLDLATCWVCNFYVDKVKEYLNLPEHLEPVALLSLGYPKEDKIKKMEKGRKSIDDIVEFW
ncbi:MAG: nitroreductase family protein [Bacteroidales bacterium]|nr:nitroreductase family protein [Bacteroidales bacterium]